MNARWLCLFALAAPVLADGLTLRSASGEAHDVHARTNRIVVLEWANFDCPFVRKHYGGDGHMQALQRTYGAKGVVWYTILAAPPGGRGYLDAEAAVAMQAELKASPRAVLMDGDQRATRLYGADRDPFVVILDGKGAVVFKGAVDDIRSWLPEDAAKATNHIRSTLDALIAGKPVPLSEARAYGCRRRP